MKQTTAENRPTAPRGIGRPVDADPERSRENILDAAEQLFASQGYAATSIREIADSVGVNTAMVHYYFGKKPQLMQAVFERVLEPVAKSIADFSPESSTSLSDFAQIVIAMASRHPNLPRLVTREVLLPGGQMREMFIQQFAPRLGGALPGIVRMQQQAGKISGDVDPPLTALLILSLSLFPFLARDVAAEALGIRYDEEGLQRLSAGITRFIERGLGPQGTNPQGTIP